MNVRQLSQPDLEAIWRQDILHDVFQKDTAASHPILLLVGGQPGSGKTGAIKQVEALHSGISFTPIIGDELRAYHPDYLELVVAPDPEVMPAATAEASGWWVRRCLDHAAANGISVAVEGTFRNPDVPLRTARRFAQAGFTTHVVALAVPAALSWLGCVSRYLNATAAASSSTRWTPREIHDQAYRALSGTLAALHADAAVHRATVWSRFADSVDLTPADDAASALERLRGPASPDASEAINAELVKVLELAGSLPDLPELVVAAIADLQPQLS